MDNPRPGARPPESRSLSDLNDFLASLGLFDGTCTFERAATALTMALEADGVAERHQDQIEKTIWCNGTSLSVVEIAELAGEPNHIPSCTWQSRTAVLEVGIPNSDSTLVILRRGAQFSRDEVAFAVAATREIVLAINADSAKQEAAEMVRKQQSADRRLELAEDRLDRSRGLIDRLTQIQELISLRRPVELLLESVKSAASYLIPADSVEIHILDARAAAEPPVEGVATPGPGTAARTAVDEDRLVLDSEPEKDPDTGDVVVVRVMAAPIRVSGRLVGCIRLSRKGDGVDFSPDEQESVIALSLHAALALQDSRAVEAMRMSLERERHRSEHDQLTGLPNRATVLETLTHELEHLQSRPVSVLFVDVDNFKMTNDMMGHRSGDEALKIVADRVVAAVRDVDVVGRVAADEFVVICSGVSGLGAVDLARRVQERVALPMRVSGRDHVVTVSVGVASGSSSDSAEKLVADADLAAGRAKSLGRARVELFDVELRRIQQERMATLREIRRAIDEDQLEVHLQPVVSLPERRVVSFEALARWRHPSRGLVLPDEFIPLAEETDLIADIDRRVMESMLVLLSQQESRRPIAVNVSARTLSDPGFATWMRSRLDEHSLEGEWIVVEITETVLLGSGHVTGDQLRELRDLGVKVVLDDFGTGYSSLSTLQALEVDGVKIDRTFVSRLGSDPRAEAIVSAVFHMAVAMGLTVVAEGVETDEQARRLVELRDDSGQVKLRGQGYLFGRPAESGSVMSGFLEMPLLLPPPPVPVR